MDLDTFTACVDEVMRREIPEALLRELNLGVHVFPEEQRDGNRYVLGHYSINRLGRHIALFYGSFAAIYDGRPDRIWKREISRTLRHEIRHHVESLAGNEELAKEEHRAKAREQWETAMKRRKPSPFERLIQSIRHHFRD